MPCSRQDSSPSSWGSDAILLRSADVSLENINKRASMIETALPRSKVTWGVHADVQDADDQNALLVLGIEDGV